MLLLRAFSPAVLTLVFYTHMRLLVGAPILSWASAHTISGTSTRSYKETIETLNCYADLKPGY